MKIKKSQISKDGSIKYLLETADKEKLEAIYFDFSGKYNGRIITDKVICLSSQIGCSLGCTFCETGKIGLVRDLSSNEMCKEVDLIKEDILKKRLPSPKYLALMGMGEPLLNLENVKNFFKRNKEKFKGISLSTCGIPEGITNLAEDSSVNFLLYISLHSPYDSQRNQLIPLNKRFPIKSILNAGKKYYKAKGNKTVITYMTIPGINDSNNHFKKLGKIVDPRAFTIQLTCFNQNNKKNSNQIKKKFDIATSKFSKHMQKERIEYDIQTSKGSDIAGGCGQLANKSLKVLK